MSQSAVVRSRRVCARAFSAVCAASVAALAFALALEPTPAAALGYSAVGGDAPRAPRKAKRAKSAAPKASDNSSVARPLFAVVSLGGQHISIYNHNGLVERSTISTGVPGHPTPEGVFTILGRERFHRSNLYSGAPMPFMQRVTWSGVAMHEGHVTGRPASHGCIRLPGAFAQKLWGLTRIGERVVIAPYDLSPSEISHPALPSPKMRSPSEASAATFADAGLRDGFADSSAPLVDPRRYAEQMKTKAAADAAAASKAATEASVALNAKRQEAARASAELKSAEAAEASARAKAEAAKKAAESAAAKRQEAAAAKSDPPAAETTPAEAAKAKADAALAEAKARLEAAKTAFDASDAAYAEAARLSRETAEASAAAAKAEKDAQLRIAPISILVSKKNQRIYVRQGLTPIFEAPATIREPERPLGSHLYIASAAGDDGALKWSVLSMPPRVAMARAGKKKGMVEERSAAPMGPASSAADALDRVELSDDVREKIADRLWLGGSIIVSDQGPSSETGAVGTDLTVKFR